jgi:hypothetical protein
LLRWHPVPLALSRSFGKTNSVSFSFRGLSTDWNGGQLKHGGVLTFFEQRQQNNLAIRKF